MTSHGGRRTSWCATVVVLAGITAAATAQAPETPTPLELEMAKGEVRAITRAEADRYLAAISELTAAGRKAEATHGGSDGPDAEADRLVRAKWQEVLSRHGFDAKQFASVHASLWQAFGALQMQENAPQMEAMMEQHRAALEQMKEHMSAEEYEQARKDMEVAGAQMQHFAAEVPPGNLELVRKLEPKLRALDEAE